MTIQCEAPPDGRWSRESRHASPARPGISAEGKKQQLKLSAMLVYGAGLIRMVYQKGKGVADECAWVSAPGARRNVVPLGAAAAPGLAGP